MAEVTKQPKRRWLRFNLRSLVIVLTIFCVWLGWYLYRVEQQRNSVKWVLENGGTVRYDYEIHLDGLVVESQPPVPKWLRDRLGVDYFSTVTFVDLLGTQVSDVTPLATLKNLQRLYLSYTQVSDVTPLAGLTNLECLLLENTHVSDVTPLAGLTNLKGLLLYDTQVSDVTPLATLKNLQWLHLYNTHISDVTPLAGLTNLENLWLFNTNVTDTEIEKLQLALPNCQIYK